MADLVELLGSRRHLPPGARPVATVPRERVGRMTLLMRRRSDGPSFPSVLEQAAALPRQRRYLSRGEVAELHGTDPADVSLVEEFASTRGLRVDRPNPLRRLVHLTGRSVDLAAAFDAEIQRYRAPFGEYIGRVDSLYVPAELGHILLGAFGLDERPAASPHLRVSRSTSALGYDPKQVGSAYAFPTATDGRGRCIGLLEFGGGFEPADLAAYFPAQGVSPPAVAAIPVGGAANAPTGDPTGPDGEVTLDIEVAGALAPGATIAVYFAPNTEQGFVEALSAAIHDTDRSPSVVSISWGAPESSWTAQARTGLSSLAEDAAAAGVTVLAAAGDSGADDAGPGTGLAVDFPASSPFVLACGGTRLVLAGSGPPKETVWNGLADDEGATGGGVSERFPLPAYQTNAAVPPAPTGAVGRGLPDVAASADPRNGFRVRVDGRDLVFGGTSAAAPLWAALLARIGQSTGARLGLVQPPLYAAGGAGFRDITDGDNGGYAARLGWDPCSGLGSPNGTALLKVLGGVPAPPLSPA